MSAKGPSAWERVHPPTSNSRKKVARKKQRLASGVSGLESLFGEEHFGGKQPVQTSSWANIRK